MNEQRKYKLKRILRTTLWSLAGIALFVLLLSAMHRNSKLVCMGMEIAIEGYNHEMYISEEEVKTMLEAELDSKIEGAPFEKLELRKLEKSLQRNPWISKAQLFVDNQQMLHVNISERMPVARVFTRTGQSFYMDSSAVELPLSINEIADVPVFTNVPDAGVEGGVPMVAADSLLRLQVSKMGNFIKKDSFLLMQLGQIDITPNANYVMYPAIGNHIIEFGTANNYENKLKRLSVFYRKIFGKVGLNKYEVLDLRYDKQIVATLRGKQEGRIDSAAAMRKFEELVNRTVSEANDTTVKVVADKGDKLRQEVITSTSLQPVDGTGTNDKPVEQEQEDPPKKAPPKPAETVTAPKENKPIINTPKPKPMVQQPANKPKPTTEDAKQPKAVMPKRDGN